VSGLLFSRRKCSAISWREQVNLQCDNDDRCPLFTIQHAYLDMHSAISLPDQPRVDDSSAESKWLKAGPENINPRIDISLHSYLDLYSAILL
jgi:hypothetical protein